MADPPSYDEIEHEYPAPEAKGDSKVPQRFSIREEVGASRAQHVAALVSKLLPQVRSRAKQGLSKSTLILLPSNQESSRKGQLVGFPEDEPPVLVQLEGQQDTLEFWTQHEALNLLQSQMLEAISGTVSIPPVQQPLPERTAPPHASKSSVFGRKSNKVSEPRQAPELKQVRPPVSVTAELDEVHFRSENDFGLFETLRGRCVLVTIDVR